MLLADDPTPWYNTTWLWGAVAAVIALTALYAAWRAIPARSTTLYYWRFDQIQLVRSDSAVPVTLEIRRNGTVLHDPYLVQVLLATRGRADVGKDAFNGPIVLDIGAPIVDVLKFESDAEHIPTPPWQAGGSALRMGPALLARRHELIFSLLIDGPPTSPLALNNRPRDVTVQAAPSTAQRPSLLLLVLLAIAGVLFNLIGFALLSSHVGMALLSSDVGMALMSANVAFESAALLGTEAVMGAFVVWLLWALLRGRSRGRRP